MTRPPLATMVLGVSAVILALCAGMAQWWPAASGVPTAPVRAAPRMPQPTAAEDAAAPSLASLTQAPIFHRSRTFVAVEDPDELAASRPSYVLAAAMTLPRGRSVAYLRKPGESVTVRVGVGDDLGGWTVKSIDVRRVVAMRGNASAEFVPAVSTTNAGLVRVAAGSATRPAPGPARVLGGQGLVASVRGGRAFAREEARTFRPPPH